MGGVDLFAGMQASRALVSQADVRHIDTAFRMATPSTMRAIAVGAVIALFFGAPRAARANGRYPLANQLVVDPGDPGHLVARTTFGILESHDSGATSGWICETLIGSLGSTEDPAIAVTAGGTTVAASSSGSVRVRMTGARGARHQGSPMVGSASTSR